MKKDLFCNIIRAGTTLYSGFLTVITKIKLVGFHIYLHKKSKYYYYMIDIL